MPSDKGDGPAGEQREPVASSPEQPPARPVRRPHRRVTTPPPEGSDPSPAPEPPQHPLTANDERLRAEKPPHY